MRNCSVCEREVDTFKSFAESIPEIYRELVQHDFDLTLLEYSETCSMAEYTCGHCGANDRDRLCALYLRHVDCKHNNGNTLHLLDVAPSPSLRQMIKSLTCFEYRSADLLRGDVDDVVDITNLDLYDSGRFDCVICSHVLEHVQDDSAATRELFRVLKPGGWGIFLVPLPLNLDATRHAPAGASVSDRVRLCGQFDHVRLYSKRDFVSLLVSTGFEVDELGMPHFGSEVFSQSAISPTSILYVCRKPRR